MREDVVTLLAALGVAGAAENPLLDLVINQVQWRIKNLTNLQEVPEGLVGLAVQMAAGEFLSMLKASGQLSGFELEEAAIKQIQEGDTNTVFSVGDGSYTPEQRLDSLIDFLINGRVGEIYRYRKMVW